MADGGLTPIDPAVGLFGRLRGPIVVDLFAGAGGALRLPEGARAAVPYPKAAA